jgi:hypothetical protein
MDNTLSVFRIDQSAGTLSRIAGSPITIGSAPVAIAANPRGRCVHVLSAANSTLTTYLIGVQRAIPRRCCCGFNNPTIVIGTFLFMIAWDAVLRAQIEIRIMAQLGAHAVA